MSNHADAQMAVHEPIVDAPHQTPAVRDHADAYRGSSAGRLRTGHGLTVLNEAELRLPYRARTGAPDWRVVAGCATIAPSDISCT